MLPIGVYHLVEIQAPNGYDPKQNAVVVTVTGKDVLYDEGTSLSASGNGKSYDAAAKLYTLKLSNSAGYILPSTGGPGLRGLTLLGAVLILGAAALLRRRRSRKGR